MERLSPQGYPLLYCRGRGLNIVLVFASPFIVLAHQTPCNEDFTADDKVSIQSGPKFTSQNNFHRSIFDKNDLTLHVTMCLV